MRNAVLIRSNPISPDPPVEKAADALLAQGYGVTILGWNRSEQSGVQTSLLKLERGTAQLILFVIPAFFGGGFRRNLLPLIRFQISLLRWLSEHRAEYDIIHAFDFDTGLSACKIAQKYKKAFVYHILDFYVASHHLPAKMLKSLILNAEHSIINRADCTILCTEKRIEQISGSRPRKLEIIHNTPKPFNSNLPMHLSETSVKRCRIAFVGTLLHARFLEEIMEFVANDERFELHIGGFGVLEETIISAAKHCSRIHFYGKLPYEKTLALEDACDVMAAIYDPAVTNHQYAAPNKFYEALMLGKPIIMAKNTGFDDVFENHCIGCLIDYSKSGLAEGMNFMLEQRHQWAAMGEEMRQLYQNEYSWAEMEKRLIKLYSEL